jgi:cytochrome c biogenesis protein CcmG, thiol:disulfide interchange protein DsbE
MGYGGCTVNQKRLFIAIFIFSLMSFTGCARKSSDTQSSAIDKTAPDISLYDMQGRQVSLKQFRGKPVMLDFWATWCGPCRMTMPLTEKLRKEYQNSLIVLAVNLQESEEDVRQYVQQEGIKTLVLLDKEGAAAEAYGIETIPALVLIDKSGVIRQAWRRGYYPEMMSEFRAAVEKVK